ncbi:MULTISPECIES: hypothetical protein [Vibrio]|jgi:hypothetical protein|uniref:Uncharacterized protein n=2 Tax=Vibrio TaxID=662 RepID=A0A5N3R6J6_9VIBR|nr:MULTISPECIES: hypothetical protein [Vibrio]KAB0290066.1 hypothetical protein F2P58_03795 [Vibrio fortis]MBE4522261.1 hypothetical protein [Vibrio parahaemolyticus]TOF98298.1 hypothetical protein CGJ11_22895 [Vibrio parahaemolyticus]
MDSDKTVTDSKTRTARQWLALPTKDKRYPKRGAIGMKGKRGIYFHISQTKPVRSEATHHPFFDVLPVPEQYKNLNYYYFDECEEKKTVAQWRKEGRIVKSGSVPCSDLRSGFNPKTNEHFQIQFFLRTDTRPIGYNGL